VGWTSVRYSLENVRSRAKCTSAFLGLGSVMSNVVGGVNVVTFLGMDCTVKKEVYRYKLHRQPALQLLAADTPSNRKLGLFPGEPVMTATVCVDYPFEKGETAVKNCSENEGILDVLVDAKIVEITGKVAQSGNCAVPVVKLLI